MIRPAACDLFPVLACLLGLNNDVFVRLPDADTRVTTPWIAGFGGLACSPNNWLTNSAP